MTIKLVDSEILLFGLLLAFWLNELVLNFILHFGLGLRLLSYIRLLNHLWSLVVAIARFPCGGLDHFKDTRVFTVLTFFFSRERVALIALCLLNWCLLNFLI